MGIWKMEAAGTYASDLVHSRPSHLAWHGSAMLLFDMISGRLSIPLELLLLQQQQSTTV